MLGLGKWLDAKERGDLKNSSFFPLGIFSKFLRRKIEEEKRGGEEREKWRERYDKTMFSQHVWLGLTL